MLEEKKTTNISESSSLKLERVIADKLGLPFYFVIHTEGWPLKIRPANGIAERLLNNQTIDIPDLHHLDIFLQILHSKVQDFTPFLKQARLTRESLTPGVTAKQT